MGLLKYIYFLVILKIKKKPLNKEIKIPIKFAILGAREKPIFTCKM